MHEDGIRAARARPCTLFITPGSNQALIRRLADRYGASLVEVRGPRALLAYCREHDIGMNAAVVSELLGIGDPSERRRARFRKDALRVVAASDAQRADHRARPPASCPTRPAHGTLFGRTGEIHTR